MAQWRIKPWALIVLGFVTLVMLLIVVLPDVDLLDTAFQRGTAPITIHSQATSAPALIFEHAFRLPDTTTEAFAHFHTSKSLCGVSTPNFLPILLRSIRR